MLKALTLAEGTERCGLVYARRESEAATSGSAMMPPTVGAYWEEGNFDTNCRRYRKIWRITEFGDDTGIWRIQEFGEYRNLDSTSSFDAATTRITSSSRRNRPGLATAGCGNSAG
jgi:hypothetical protein